MKKNGVKVFILLASLIFIVGCSDTSAKENGSSETQNPDDGQQVEPVKPHEHTFSKIWSSDQTHHWHKATCEHSDLISDKAEHSFVANEVPATYQSGGTITYTCSICNYSYTETTEMLVHSYSDEWEHNENAHWHPCLDSGYESLKQGYSKHEYQTKTVNPTFEDDGYVEYVCECGYSYRKILNKVNHNYDTKYSSDEKGHWHACIDEGYDDLVLDYAEHTFSSEEVLPTYDEEGYTKYTCDECGFSYTETIDKLIHNYSNEYDHDENKHWHACIDKGYEELSLDEGEHVFEDEVIKPTFEEKGYTKHTCKECGYSYEDTETDVLEHTYSKEWSSDGWRHWHACLDEGYEDLKIDNELHEYYEVYTQGTFEEKGYSTFICEDCGKSFISYAGGDYKPHEFSSEWSSDDSNHWHYCTDEGYTTLTSDNAAHEYSGWVIDKMPTENEDGLAHRGCSICGYAVETKVIDKSAADPSSYLKFTLSADETYYIVSGFKENRKIFLIPEEYNNLPVKSIASYAFNYCSMNECIIPETVTEIGSGAFSYCYYLKSIVIPSKIQYLQSDTFSYCTSLEEVAFFDGLTSIGYACFRSTSLSDVKFPSTLKTINGYAFNSCNYLKNIDFNNGLERINYYSFSYCDQLEKVEIPETVFFIDNSAFSYNKSLKRIDISGENVNYSSIDGLLTNSDKTYLCIVPSGISGEFSIPNGITNVLNAFYGCNQITSINIPDSMTYISSDSFNSLESLVEIKVGSQNNYYYLENGMLLTKTTNPSIIFCSRDLSGKVIIPDGVQSINSYCFRGLKNITEIEMPDSVQAINYSAFADCESLEKITLSSSITNMDSNVFNNCKSLESITIPSSLTFVNSSLFYNCTSLKIVKLPDNLTRIEGSAFENCTSLTEINLPESLNYIGAWAFYNTRLSEVTIPEGVTRIESYTFYNCNYLEKINLPSTLTAIDNNAFYSCTALESFDMPDSVTYLGSYSFYNCTSLKSIRFSSSLTQISSYTCNYCTSLTNVVLPSSITKIYSYAFSNCYGLVQMEVPESVEEIENYAFSNCNIYEVINKSNLNISLDDREGFGAISYNAVSIINDASESKLVDENGLITFENDNNEKMLLKYTGNDYVVEIPEGINVISRRAFYNAQIFSVTLPSSLTSIQDEAFSNCYYLKEVINHSSLQLYAGQYWDYGRVAEYAVYVTTDSTAQSRLVFNGDLVTMKDNSDNNVLLAYIGNDDSFTIPTNIDIVGSRCFERKGIKEITIPNSVKYFRDCAFLNCSQLKNVYFNGTLDDWLTIDFNYYGNPCTNGADLYFNNELVEDLTISANQGNGTIKSYAFQGCKSLKKLTISDSITNIYSQAFANCINLEEIILPSSGINFDSEVFSGCTSLEEIIIPEGITYLGSYIFTNCNSLKKVSLPSTLQSIGYQAFGNCNSLTSINIPDDITSINGWVFYDCTSLEEIRIPDNVTYIGEYAFYNCSSLTHLVIPNNVTQIENYAFYYCNNLKYIVLPASLQYLSYGIVTNCSSLTAVYYYGNLEQWETLNTNNPGQFANINIYIYSEDEPTTEGLYWHMVNGVITIW